MGLLFALLLFCVPGAAAVGDWFMTRNATAIGNWAATRGSPPPG